MSRYAGAAKDLFLIVILNQQLIPQTFTVVNSSEFYFVYFFKIERHGKINQHRENRQGIVIK